MIVLRVLGSLVLWWFFRSARAKEASGREPLLSLHLFDNRVSNLGLVTQNGPFGDRPHRHRTVPDAQGGADLAGQSMVLAVASALIVVFTGALAVAQLTSPQLRARCPRLLSER
ncbi:hypothetical protein [Streptomyces sp. NPDC058305]